MLRLLQESITNRGSLWNHKIFSMKHAKQLLILLVITRIDGSMQIALYLPGRTCILEYEVPTVKGRYADFRVTRNDNTFFLHVKRLNVDKETENDMKYI